MRTVRLSTERETRLRGFVGAIKRTSTALCLGALASCSGTGQPSPLRDRIDSQIEANAELHGIPAQAVLVMRNGEVLYRNQTGLADLESGRAVGPDDVYPVYSVSKLFASILVFQLVDHGRLDLQQPASSYIPDLPSAWQEIRVDQFLNHTSGIPDFIDRANPSAPLPPTRGEVFRMLANRPLLARPGTQTSYNQTNYLVLQAILEQIYDAPYREIVRRRIIEPLGLRDTFMGLANAPLERLVSAYHGEDGRLVRDLPIAWRDYSIVHTELYTTPDDLGTFLSAVAHGDLVRQETLARLWQPHRLENGDVGWFASGWDYGESGQWREVGHDGGIKVRVRLIFRNGDPGSNAVIVYLTNGTRDNVWTRTLVESVQRIILLQ